MNILTNFEIILIVATVIVVGLQYSKDINNK